jgi:hypothetical protein
MAASAAAVVAVAVGGSDAHGGGEMPQGKSLTSRQQKSNEGKVNQYLNGGLLGGVCGKNTEK